MKKNYCKYCDKQYAALSSKKRYCSRVCRDMFYKEGKSLRDQVHEKMELKQKEAEAKKEAKRAEERRARMMPCGMCREPFEPKASSKYCSEPCRARMTKLKQAVIRQQRKGSGNGGNRFVGDKIDYCYETRDFSPEFEEANPHVVDTMLAEAQERNKKLKYNNRCSVCMSKILDESVEVSGNTQPIDDKWYCSDGCYSIREPQIKKGSYRHKVSSGEGMKYV